MRREIIIHAATTVVFFLLLVIVKQLFDLDSLWFWIGGLLGTILPDVDHLIYIYVLRPGELTSQRVEHLIEKKDITHSLDLMYRTRGERRKLIFHTALFQTLFVALAFLVVTSGGSLLGSGIVLAFLLHLAVDQIVGFNQEGIDSWFRDTNFKLERNQQALYVVAHFLVLLILGFVY